MCNIAGYVGSERAAPILLELIEHQEGLAGGYYTGIATIDEGRLHWAKVVGDAARLRAETDAEELPGTIGLAHSRSNSGGDRRWSHPFIACDDALAYIANGSMGYFEGKTDTAAAARRLEAEGHAFTAVADEQIGKYPSLSGGRSVHVSDVMAHSIEAELQGGGEPEQAMARVFLRLPAEIVGVFITPSHPDAIFGARYTMPMCVAVDDTGARVASSPTALPADLRWWTWVPPCSVATVRAGGLQMRPLGSPSDAVTDDIARSEARRVILERLSDEEQVGFGALAQAVRTLSQREELVVTCDPVYETLWELLREGRIACTTLSVPGAEPGLDAPRLVFSAAKGTRVSHGDAHRGSP